MISSILSKYISSKNKRTLLIDFDNFNRNINTIFGVKRHSKKYKKTSNFLDKNEANIINKNIYNYYINKHIFSINNYLNLFLGTDEIFNINEEINLYKIKEVLKILKKEYDFIIIDTSSRIDFNYVKLVLSSADKILFLIEPNILELKKSNNLLEVFIKDWNIEIDKIKIIFNKTNKYKIAESILEEIFSDFEILGSLQYEEEYNLFINKNSKYFCEKKEYEKIYNKIKL